MPYCTVHSTEYRVQYGVSSNVLNHKLDKVHVLPYLRFPSPVAHLLTHVSAHLALPPMTPLTAFLLPAAVAPRALFRSAVPLRHPLSPSFLPRPHRLLSTPTSHPTESRPSPHFTTTATVSAPTSERLADLRAHLVARNVDAMIIPTPDPHNSEYTAPHFARREHISAFTGSAGTVVVTADTALLWTDGRYFLQAETQLDDNWTLMRAGLPDTPTIPKFLADQLKPGSRVGIDPFLHSLDAASALREALAPVGSDLVSLEQPNPVDLVWPDRPAAPAEPLRLHAVQYAGRTVSDKLAELRVQMAEKKTSHLLLSMLDEVAWAFNIRGADIPCNPVALSYALIDTEGAILYVAESKVDRVIREALSAEGVVVRPYESVEDDVRALVADGAVVWVDPSSTSVALGDAAGDAALRETTPVPLAKAVKNDTELAGMRAAHARDGVALSGMLCWLEDELARGVRLSETDVVAAALRFRSQQTGFISTSFDTIAGSGANGAIIHYSPQEEDCANVSDTEMLLVDSGGQYVDGTTDVTRTVHLGSPTEFERRCFTRVLQGHIALDRATFPPGTTGLMLDALARTPLWSEGLDYRHGTGHGVGACLNVHEGPQSISPRPGSNKAALKAGMIVSNEPGFYEDGKFGIRIENLVAVVEKQTANEFGGSKFLGFERLTYVPMERKLMMTDLMSKSEIEWVDRYHDQVWEVLSPLVENERLREWLWEKTRPLEIVAMQKRAAGVAGTSTSGMTT